MSAPLYSTPPWRDHGFPLKRITRKACRASADYSCQTIGPTPAGHVATIPQGEPYLRVAIRPPKHGSGVWVSVRLCRACGLFFGLATETKPAPFTGGARL